MKTIDKDDNLLIKKNFVRLTSLFFFLCIYLSYCFCCYRIRPKQTYKNKKNIRSMNGVRMKIPTISLSLLFTYYNTTNYHSANGVCANFSLLMLFSSFSLLIPLSFTNCTDFFPVIFFLLSFLYTEVSAKFRLN